MRASRRIGLSLGLAVAVLPLGMAHSQTPASQNPATAATAQIDVVPVIMAEPASETAINIRVGPPEALPKNAFVRIRGLPQRVTLSAGYQVAAGVWAVPLFGLATLKCSVPSDVMGRSELQISLISLDGAVIAEAKAALLIAQINAAPAQDVARVPSGSITPPAPLSPPVPAGRPDRTAKADLSTGLVPRATQPEPTPKGITQPAAVPAAQPPAMMPELRQRLERLVQQGDKVLAQGNIASARQFFLRAADAGLGAAALKLAQTYDPVILAGLPIQGLTGDAREARVWYQRAADLGENAATDALKRIDGR